MEHPEPLFKPAGDAFIEVELGNEMGFDLNVRVHAFAAAIRAAALPGVVELVPELASMLVAFDPDQIDYDDVVRELRAIHAQSRTAGADVIPGRLFEIPVLYFDEWTTACVEEYRKDHPDKQTDPEILCATNGLADRDALVRVHSSGEYWAAALGFWPGLCSLMPLDPRARLTAPKYNPPRGWTPKGTIGLGGGLSCIYPDRTPGGYQIFGRTPAPTWDKAQRLAAFQDSPALFRPGDRVRFVPIDRAQYADIEAQVADGSYVHTVRDRAGFSIQGYRAWLQSIGQETRHA